MDQNSKKQLSTESVSQCRDQRHRGERHWYRITGLKGWERAARGLPAWGKQWEKKQA